MSRPSTPPDRRKSYRVVFQDGTATYVSANSQRDAMERAARKHPARKPLKAHRS